MRVPVLKEVTQTVKFDESELTFLTQFSKRKTLAILIYPSGKLVIKAPYKASLRQVHQFVYNHKNWIKNKQTSLQNITPLHKKLAENECEFLGKIYQINIIQDLINGVILAENLITIKMTKPNVEKAKNLLKKWYENKAEVVFNERINLINIKTEPLGIKYCSKAKIRKMKSRWGSCSSFGKITLNFELIKTPLECIDYVIAHELCHLKYFNHSTKFYSLLSKIMPDWKQHKTRLKSFAT
jgi:hypothetical protein